MKYITIMSWEANGWMPKCSRIIVIENIRLLAKNHCDTHSDSEDMRWNQRAWVLTHTVIVLTVLVINIFVSKPTHPLSPGCVCFFAVYDKHLHYFQHFRISQWFNHFLATKILCYAVRHGFFVWSLLLLFLAGSICSQSKIQFHSAGHVCNTLNINPTMSALPLIIPGTNTIYTKWQKS